MLRVCTKLMRAGGAGFGAGFLVISVFAWWASAAHAGNGSYKDNEVVDIVAPLHAWHGCYVGFSAGGNIDTSSARIGGAVTEVTNKPSDGLALGGYTGCSLQMGSLVIGVEGDINTASDDPHWFGSARGRLGVTLSPTMLLYVTGGYAFADRDYTVIAPTETVRVSGTNTGKVYGGGFEFAMGSTHSVRLEALHYDYDASRTVAGMGFADVDQTHTVIRFGVTINLSGGFFDTMFNGPDPDVIQ